jgi:hypothetical protein
LENIANWSCFCFLVDLQAQLPNWSSPGSRKQQANDPVSKQSELCIPLLTLNITKLFPPLSLRLLSVETKKTAPMKWKTFSLSLTIPTRELQENRIVIILTFIQKFSKITSDFFLSIMQLDLCVRKRVEIFCPDITYSGGRSCKQFQQSICYKI